MPAIPRILVEVDSRDAMAWHVAIAFADKICADSGNSVRDVVLLTHTKRQLDQTDLSRYIGEVHSKILSKGGVLNLPSGARLRSKTLKTLDHLSSKTVVIVYWAEMDILDHADGLRNLAGIVAIPDFSGEADQWEQRWSPTVYGRSAKNAGIPLISDLTVEKALQTLTNIVNLSTGLGHPRDKDHATNILKILRHYGHKVEPENLKSWAITHGWRPKDAANLSALADKILGQKTKPSLSEIYNARERYEMWL